MSHRWPPAPALSMRPPVLSGEPATSSRAVSPGLFNLLRPLLASIAAGCSSGLLFGYDIGAMASTASEVRAAFHLSPSGLGLAVSSALLGTVVGSLLAGSLADSLGRRATIALASVLYLFAAVSAAISAGAPQFFCSRFVCGLAVGLLTVVAPMYLAEIAPAERRGAIVGSFQLSLSFGVVCAFSAGYLSSLLAGAAATWRYDLCGGVLPAAFCLIALTGSKPGRLTSTDAPAREPLFQRRYLRPILLGLGLALFNQLTGVNALLYYVLDVFRGLGVEEIAGRRNAFLLAVMGLLITVSALYFIDRAGRRFLLLTGAAGMGLCLLLVSLAGTRHWPAGIVLLLIAGYHAFFGFSQGAVVWVYLSEIFPPPVRARGQALASTVLWITNMLVVDIFPTLAYRYENRIFSGLAILLLIQFSLIFVFYPETKGRTLASDAL